MHAKPVGHDNSTETEKSLQAALLFKIMAVKSLMLMQHSVINRTEDAKP
jgi:hypothetical protein